MKSIAKPACLALVMSVAGSAVLASGGGPSSGYGGDRFNQPRVQNDDDAIYQAGRKLYSRKLACDKCPMADKRLTAELARELLKNKMGAELTAEEAQLVDFYLRSRFSL